MVQLVIASYLEDEFLDRIRGARDDVCVHARSDLVPPPRYPADHTGAGFERDPAAEAEWRALLSQADAMFDFDYVRPRNLIEQCPRLRWVQASSAGIGSFVQRHGLDASNITFTTAAGIHGQPLAEFVVWSMLTTAKDYPKARAKQRSGDWQRFHGGEILGSTLLIVGLGGIGRRVAELVGRLGVRVVGTKRTVGSVDAAALGVDVLVAWTELDDVLPAVDHVVLACPLTPETEGLIDRRRLRRFKPGSSLVNIGRGGLVDHEALIDALDEGRPATAILDVTDPEPLPKEHPLWWHERVVIFPHSASTSVRENERLTDLFIDNLHRFVEGRALRNVYQRERRY